MNKTKKKKQRKSHNNAKNRAKLSRGGALRAAGQTREENQWGVGALSHEGAEPDLAED